MCNARGLSLVYSDIGILCGVIGRHLGDGSTVVGLIDEDLLNVDGFREVQLHEVWTYEQSGVVEL